MSYLLIVVLVGLLILVHELGHFAAARMLGMPVKRFSVGFGPRLWSFGRRGTEYRLSAFPIGGYVLLHLEDEQAYLGVSLRHRLCFSLAGPAANLLLAVPLLWILNLSRGDTSLYTLTVGPFVQTGHMLVQFLSSLGAVFSHPGQLSSIVGIVAEGGKFVGLDPARLIQFAIVITLNLAIFNLLPLPPLDGGKMVLDVLHRLRPRLARAFTPVYVTGWILILGLILYATVLDIGRLGT